MSKTIRVAVFIPGCAEPAFTEIENTLESWQGLCGGLAASSENPVRSLPLI